jgi:hypothetical protein
LLPRLVFQTSSSIQHLLSTNGFMRDFVMRKTHTSSECCVPIRRPRVQSLMKLLWKELARKSRNRSSCLLTRPLLMPSETLQLFVAILASWLVDHCLSWSPKMLRYLHKSKCALPIHSSTLIFHPFLSGSHHWHSDTAGPSPQLYRWIKNTILGVPQRLDVPTASSDLDIITSKYGPFIDFWSIVIV